MTPLEILESNAELASQNLANWTKFKELTLQEAFEYYLSDDLVEAETLKQFAKIMIETYRLEAYRKFSIARGELNALKETYLNVQR